MAIKSLCKFRKHFRDIFGNIPGDCREVSGNFPQHIRENSKKYPRIFLAHFHDFTIFQFLRLKINEIIIFWSVPHHILFYFDRWIDPWSSYPGWSKCRSQITIHRLTRSCILPPPLSHVVPTLRLAASENGASRLAIAPLAPMAYRRRVPCTSRRAEVASIAPLQLPLAADPVLRRQKEVQRADGISNSSCHRPNFLSSSSALRFGFR